VFADRVDEKVSGGEEGEVGKELTQVPNTGRHEARSYQRLAMDVVPLSLQ
jgi:hypothetical protein